MHGDKIRVIDGALYDCCGLYEGMNSRERVAILLDLLGRKVRALDRSCGLASPASPVSGQGLSSCARWI